MTLNEKAHLDSMGDSETRRLQKARTRARGGEILGGIDQSMHSTGGLSVSNNFSHPHHSPYSTHGTKGTTYPTAASSSLSPVINSNNLFQIDGGENNIPHRFTSKQLDATPSGEIFQPPRRMSVIRHDSTKPLPFSEEGRKGSITSIASSIPPNGVGVGEDPPKPIAYRPRRGVDRTRDNERELLAKAAAAGK